MKGLIFTAVLTLTTVTLYAQTAREELDANPNRSASCYYAYPEPVGVKYTPAPKGYKPCYMSHYGRHGSRFLLGDRDYDQPLSVLMRADSLGRLTPRGKKMLKDVMLMREESRNRIGELTPLGAQQHRDIARRMARNFPEIFAGKAHVDARSTMVIRCILSMDNEMQELVRMNPQLSVSTDASAHDLWYMCADDKPLQDLRNDKDALSKLDAFKESRTINSNIYHTLFTDSTNLFVNLSAHRFYYLLYQLGGDIQNTEYHNKMSFFDIFNKDEIYNFWLRNNASWYYHYAGCTLSGNQQYSQRFLLRKIIEQADSCLLLDIPGATMRFGHDTMIMPLVNLMNINGYGLRTDNLNDLITKDWADYRIFPMAANLQLIFYRRNKKDKDILVKVLLNEREATLPIQTDRAPYYHWNQVKAYYLKMLNDYQSQK